MSTNPMRIKDCMCITDAYLGCCLLLLLFCQAYVATFRFRAGLQLKMFKGLQKEREKKDTELNNGLVSLV